MRWLLRLRWLWLRWVLRLRRALHGMRLGRRGGHVWNLLLGKLLGLGLRGRDRMPWSLLWSLLLGTVRREVGR
jgi:hypothetical protein